MTGELIEFETTKGLLSDVMRKQAGSLSKAILEGVMNSVDAGADEIKIDIAEEQVVIDDDGDGMSEEDIRTYFKKFGLKDDDVENKQFGKFRMGRGQMFSYGRNIWKTGNHVLVVSIDEDEIDMSEVDAVPSDEVVSFEEQSFMLYDVDEDYHGTTVEIQLYDKLHSDEVSSRVDDAYSKFRYIPEVIGVQIEVGERKLVDEHEFDYETELAYYDFQEDSWSSSVEIYNQGAYVTEESLSKTAGTIVTKRDLDLNFARNQILDCDLWERVEDDYENVLVNRLLNCDSISTSERVWLIERAVDYPQIFDEPVVEDVNDELWTLTELSGKEVVFSKSSNKLAEKAMNQSGLIALKKDYEDAMDKLKTDIQKVDIGEAVDENLNFEMVEVDKDKLDSDQKDKFGILENVATQLENGLDVRPGFSSQEDYWMTGRDTLYISKDVLKQDAETLLTVEVHNMIETLAYRSDTREDTMEDYSYNRNFKRYCKRIGDIQLELVQEHL